MDAMLHALGGILLNAVPTFVIVFLLYFYLNHMFFRPLSRVLQARYEATEGARRRSEEILARADVKAGEYEHAMRTARAEVYQAQEQLHQKLEAERASDLEAAHKRTEELIEEARRQLKQETAQSRERLRVESDSLANQVTDTLLGRSTT